MFTTININTKGSKTSSIHTVQLLSGFIPNQIQLLPFSKLRLNVIAHAIGVVHMVPQPLGMFLCWTVGSICRDLLNSGLHDRIKFHGVFRWEQMSGFVICNYFIFFIKRVVMKCSSITKLCVISVSKKTIPCLMTFTTSLKLYNLFTHS